MSESSTAMARGLPYHGQVCISAAAFSPMNISQPPTWARSNLSAELRTVSPRGRMHNQHPGRDFIGMTVPSSAVPSGPHVQGRQMCVQSGTGLVYSHPGIGGRFSERQPINFHHSPRRPSNHATAHLPRIEPLIFSPTHNIPATIRPEVPYPLSADLYTAQTSRQNTSGWYSDTTSSQSIYARQPDWQVAASPPSYTHDRSKNFSATVLAPQPSSLIFVEDAPPTTAPRVRKVSGPKETPFAMDTCPFFECGRSCSRSQDLERHVRTHLPPCMYCTQQGCRWTGNRREALLDHVKRKHRGVPLPGHEGFMIYDAKGLVKQLLNEEMTVEQAESEAHASFQNRALQLGKLGIWCE